MRPFLYVLLVLLACSGCGSAAAETGSSRGSAGPRQATVPLLSPKAVPGLDHVDRTLGTQALIREALGRNGIEDLVQSWQLKAAAERSFRGTTRDLTSVVARTLDFGSAAGASGFVEFVRAHPDSYMGPVKASQPVAASGRKGWVLTARGCGCHGETPLLLYVASSGPRVSWVMINGPRATTERALRLGTRAP
jgi:hypothetical protein